MAIDVHATALVHPEAELADGVTVGPWCIVERGVSIGADTWLGPNVIVRSGTSIGERNRIFQHCSIGEECQDKKYKNETTRLIVGNDNVIRESCTLHRGTRSDGSSGDTIVGSGNLFMVNVHIAHDCLIGNHCILANNCAIAGHVQMGDYVILGGFTGVHQFCRLGRFSFTGVASVILQDVPPFVRLAGIPSKPNGLNSIGLRRHGYDQKTRLALKQAYRLLLRSNLLRGDALLAVAPLAAECQPVREFADFFLSPSKRGVIRGQPRRVRSQEGEGEEL